MYTRDLSGLAQAYVAGIPFLRNSLLANIFFSYLVFYGLNGFITGLTPGGNLLKRSD
jgi:hypothetical protein